MAPELTSKVCTAWGFNHCNSNNSMFARLGLFLCAPKSVNKDGRRTTAKASRALSGDHGRCHSFKCRNLTDSWGPDENKPDQLQLTWCHVHLKPAWVPYTAPYAFHPCAWKKHSERCDLTDQNAPKKEKTFSYYLHPLCKGRSWFGYNPASSGPGEMDHRQECASSRILF